MTLRRELDQCRIGDIAFNNLARHDLRDAPKLKLIDVDSPCCNFWKAKTSSRNTKFTFVQALATLPDSTAKVRVWKRVK